MAKLYFKYGAMGSSKTAQALITKFNYEERGMRVFLIKPATDTRDGDGLLASRAGLSSPCRQIAEGDDLYRIFREEEKDADVVICDECQFFTPKQIDEMREIVDDYDIPVICFGLRTDFQCKLFPGSARLFELADSITEIKTMCACGRKATVNARLGRSGKVVTRGDQIVLGGNDRYLAMCHRCWTERIRKEREDK